MFRKIIFIALAALAVLSCKKDRYVPYSQDVVAFTGDYSDLTSYSVTLTGTVSPASNMRVNEMGIYLSKDPVPVENNSAHYSKYDGDYTFSYEFTNLEPETTYYYRTYLFHRDGFTLEKWDYGETKSFTTPSNEVSVSIDHMIVSVTTVYMQGTVNIKYDRGNYITVYLMTGKTQSEVEYFGAGSSASTYVNTDRTFELTKEGMEESGWYYRTYILFEGVEYYGEIKHISPMPFAPTAGEIIDMGLSVKWRSLNVGATYPEECGDYYSWGETSTRSNIMRADSEGAEGEEMLPLSMDAAYVNLGEQWRMPTHDEITELRRETIHEYGEYRSMNGYLIVSKKNGNSLFFPAAGYQVYGSISHVGKDGIYWASTATVENGNRFAYAISFKFPVSGRTFPIVAFSGTDWGCSIRPVYREL